MRNWSLSPEPYVHIYIYMVVSLNYSSPNGGNLYRAPYHNGNPSIGPRIIGNLDQYPYIYIYIYRYPYSPLLSPFKGALAPLYLNAHPTADTKNPA